MERIRNRDLVDSADVDRGLDSVLIDETESIDYRELRRREHQLAQVLRARGIAEGDRIAYAGRNSIRFIEVLLAARLAGAILVPLSPRLAQRELIELVRDSDARIVFVADEAAAKLEDIAGQLGDCEIVSAYGEPASGAIAWSELLGTAIDGAPITETDNADWLLMYSSGTTGLPKGVLLDQQELNRPLNAFEAWGLGPDKRTLLSMPLFHVGGLTWVLSALDHGTSIYITKDAKPVRIATLLRSERITHTFLVPVSLSELLRVDGVEPGTFPDLELIYYGAAPIDDGVLAELLRVFGPRLMQGYGSTEAGILSLLLPDEHVLEGPGSERLRSAGRLLPSGGARIVDPETLEDLPAGKVGEILVRRPVMRGYWKLPEHEREVLLEDGSYRTGDGGYVDQDGYLFLQQRMKDMIISGGENIFPGEIERALLLYPGVEEAVVIGVPDSHWGEVPYAFVRVTDKASITAEEILDHAREHLAKFKVPREVEKLDTFPRTESGKVMRRALRDPFWLGIERGIS